MGTILAELQRAVSSLDALGHRMSAVEINEAQRLRDAQARAEQTRYLKSREHLIEVQHSARQFQARADSALEPWNLRAPGPVMGQPIDEYRRDLLVMAKKQLPDDHKLRRVSVRKLEPDALAIMESQIYPAVKSAAMRPDSVPAGELREVKEVGPDGLKITKFIGTTSFVKDFTREARHARIRQPEEFGTRAFR
jgi:hypothetical protein